MSFDDSPHDKRRSSSVIKGGWYNDSLPMAEPNDGYMKLSQAWMSQADATALLTAGQYAVRTEGHPSRMMLMALETVSTVRGLLPLECEGKQDIERLLYDSFVEDVYDGELSVISCRDIETRRLAGVVFWRTMSLDEIVHRKVKALVEVQPDDVEAVEYDDEEIKETYRAAAEAKLWVKVELLATDRGLPGHNIAKMVLGAAMQVSLMRSSVDIADVGLHMLEEDCEGAVGVHLALAFGFHEEPKRNGGLHRARLTLVWDMEERLRRLLCPRREAVHHAPVIGRIPPTEAAAGHRVGALSPTFASRVPYNAGSSASTAKYGDTQHSFNAPFSPRSITTGRVFSPHQIASPSTYSVKTEIV